MKVEKQKKKQKKTKMQVWFNYRYELIEYYLIFTIKPNKERPNIWQYNIKSQPKAQPYNKKATSYYNQKKNYFFF